jgi:hypothetical protein
MFVSLLQYHLMAPKILTTDLIDDDVEAPGDQHASLRA